MRLFGAENIEGMMDKLGMDDSVPIEHKLITRSIENAQRKVESRNFDIRKHVLEYDDVINQQREVMYSERDKVLSGEDLTETVLAMIDDVAEYIVDRFAGEQKYAEEWDLEGLMSYVQQIYLPQPDFSAEDLKGMLRDEVCELLKEKARALYAQRQEEMGEEVFAELERALMLRIIDEKWMDHIDAMDQLRHGISLRAYGQRDPLVEYKFEAYNAFEDMVNSIKEDMVRYIFRVRVVAQPEQRAMVENRGEEEKARKPVRVGKKIGRNDPCPCGSGKKYKKCCGRGA